MCDIKPIRTKAEYEAALQRVDSLMDAAPGTPKGQELDLLADLVELYEYRNIPMPVPEGRALLDFWIYEKGWTAQAIDDLLDGPAGIRELLDGEQTMTPAMAETLHKHLGIPAAELLRIANTPPTLPIPGVTRAAIQQV